MHRRIAAMSSGRAWSAARRAISGSSAKRACMASAGLVRLAIAAMSATVSIGRAPTNVPLPTCRQICPSVSNSASAFLSSARLTPSISDSSRSGGSRISPAPSRVAINARSCTVAAATSAEPFNALVSSPIEEPLLQKAANRLSKRLNSCNTRQHCTRRSQPHSPSIDNWFGNGRR